MTDEVELAPSEAGDEVVSDDQITEKNDSTEAEGDREGQPAEETPEDGETEEEKARKSRNERRREAKERMQEALREAESARTETERKLKAIQEQAKSLPKPKQSDFGDYEEYQAALSAYHGLVAMDRREAQRIEAEARVQHEREKAIRQQGEQEDARNWATQMEDARTRYADFDVVALQQAPIDDRMAKMIVQSDVAADIAYHLGKNPHLGTQMAGMSDVEMARAVGRLEAQLSAPKPRTVSNAPEPIAPVRGKATAAKDPASMSSAEYRAWREKGGSL